MTLPSLTDVQFEATGWQEQTEDIRPNCRVWRDDRGDLVILTCYALPPNIPAALDDLETIWRVTRIGAFWNQAAPVSLKVGEIDGVPTLETITKFHRHTGDFYQASIIIPFRDLSYVLVVPCPPAKQDEARRVAARETFAGAPANWYRDSFNLPVISPIGFDLSDEERWDAAVPDHALSRVRRHIALLNQTANLCDAARAEPRFGAPSVVRNIAQEQAFVEVFSIGPGEREEAAAYGAALTRRIEAVLARCSTPKDTRTLLEKDNTDAANQLAVEVRAILDQADDEKVCLLLYSGKPDPTFLTSMRRVSLFYAQRDSDPSEIVQPDEMASQNFRHWEFVFSRQMRPMNFRSVAIRRDDFAYQDFAISLVKADGDDWFAKMIVLAEMADVIFSASFFNPNLSRELTYAFSTPDLQRKLIYRSSRRKFLLGDRQEVPWPEDRLVELAMFASLRKRGFPVSFSTDRDDHA